MLLYVLIIIFIILLVCQAYLAYCSSINPSLIEGLENETTPEPEYKPYNLNDPNNSLILAQQNAGNIEVLKGRIDGLDGIKKKVDEIQQSVDMMQTQIDGLVQQQADYAQELAGSTPPEVTGTEEETVDTI